MSTDGYRTITIPGQTPEVEPHRAPVDGVDSNGYLIDTPYVQPIVERFRNGEFASHAEALDALFAHDEARYLYSRDKFHEGIEDIKALLTDPVAVGALERYAAACDWAAFGKPGDRLPEGLVLHEQDGKFEVRNNRKLPSLSVPRSESVKYLFYYDPKSILYNFEYREGEVVREIAADYIASSPEAQLLDSFFTPQNSATQQPLTPYWQQVRQTQIGEDVKGRHGMVAGERLAEDFGALSAFRRQVFLLDEETMQATAKDKAGDPLARARAYFEPLILEAFNERWKAQSWDAIAVDIQPQVGIRYKDWSGDNVREDISSFCEEVAENISAAINPDNSFMRIASKTFLTHVIVSIFKYQTSGYELAEAIEHATTRALTDTQKTFMAAASGKTTFGDQYFDDISHALVLIRRPATNIVDTNYRYETPEDYLSHDKTVSIQLESENKIVDRYTYDIARSVEFGTVEGRVKGARGDMRILHMRTATRPVPTRLHEAEIFVYADTHDHYLQLEGYELVYADPKLQKFGFKYMPDKDPYVECAVEISEQQKADLECSYRGIGAVSLADRLVLEEQLTVAKLANIIAEESEYIFEPISFGRTEHIAEFNDFCSEIKNGKLQVQCTGASAFLKLSLDYIFKKNTAGSITGHTVTANRRSITEAKHAQTVFSHEGKTYILDPTPSLSTNAEVRQDVGGVAAGFLRGFGGQRSKDRKPKRIKAPKNYDVSNAQKAPKTHRIKDAINIVPNELELSPVDSDTDETKSDEKVVPGVPLDLALPVNKVFNAVRVSLFENLKVAFQLPNDDALYKFVMKLPAHDPARRALELAVRSEDGIATAEYKAQELEYLKNCSVATPEIIRTLRLQHYEQGFLESLRAITSPLAHLK